MNYTSLKIRDMLRQWCVQCNTPPKDGCYCVIYTFAAAHLANQLGFSHFTACHLLDHLIFDGLVRMKAVNGEYCVFIPRK